MDNLLGVVLCGGESKRMGTDKGLLLKDDKAWAVCVAEKLIGMNLPVIISINESQQETYQQIFKDTPLIVDHLPINGPLDGLLSIHRNFQEQDILLMACDLIDMDTETIESLIAAYRTNPSFDYYVYQQDGFTEPFCAIYTSQALNNIYKTFEAEKLTKYSLHDQFEAGNTLYIPVQNAQSFRNYNSL
ncbi:MAG: molybdenum cofactor guanylyltransferase [Sphingobacteriaceae bacterium]|nr:molybdenum cofactor guanylyltransferase [Sphingobacteriaceae bacterium]